MADKVGEVLSQDKRPELLAPAKDLETLKYAIAYGADAVYIGGKEFGLRRPASFFSLAEIERAVYYAHERGKKVYVTANIFLKNDDFPSLSPYLEALYRIQVDAVIVADPGALKLINELDLPLKVHLSTQANVTNYKAAELYYELGAARITLARELSLPEILNIVKTSRAEIEVFVHGAMCIAYSGRCLISGYLTGRQANLGECAQSCRWKYHLMEEERPGEFLPIIEDERGTYLFNSKDLCLAERIFDLIKIGVRSFKIEGRMKSLHYVTTVTRVYRGIIDECLSAKADFKFRPDWLDELKKVSHRGYTEGFISSNEIEREKTQTSAYIKTHDFLGVVTGYIEGSVRVLVKNQFRLGDEIEVMTPNRLIRFKVEGMKDAVSGRFLEVANPNWTIDIDLGYELPPFSILRKKRPA